MVPRAALLIGNGALLIQMALLILSSQRDGVVSSEEVKRPSADPVGNYLLKRPATPLHSSDEQDGYEEEEHLPGFLALDDDEEPTPYRGYHYPHELAAHAQKRLPDPVGSYLLRKRVIDPVGSYLLQKKSGYEGDEEFESSPLRGSHDRFRG